MLLNAVTSDGAGSAVDHVDSTTVHVYGTWDGATVAIQVSFNGTNWVKPDNTSGAGVLRANGTVKINHDGSYKIRAVVSEAGGSTSLSAPTSQSMT
jgi:hypothetical protein